MRMNLEAIRKNWIYVGMLLFILLFTTFSLARKSSFPKRSQSFSDAEKEIASLQRRVDVENILKEREEEKTPGVYLFGFLSFFVFTAFLIGFFLNLSLLRRKKFSLTNTLFPQVNWEISDLVRAGIFFCFFLYSLLFLEKLFLPSSFFNSFEKLLFFTLSNTILTEVAVFLFVFNFLIKGLSQHNVDHFETAPKKHVSSKSCLTALFSVGEKKTKKIALGVRAYFHLLPILFFVGLLTALLIKISGYSPAEQTFATFLLQVKSPLLLYFSIFTAVIFAPIFEEFLFRAFAYSALRRRFGVKGGILFSSFLFALLHRSLYGFLAIFILGVVLSYLYEKTGSLIPSISLHILNNGIASLFLLSLKSLL